MLPPAALPVQPAVPVRKNRAQRKRKRARRAARAALLPRVRVLLPQLHGLRSLHAAHPSQVMLRRMPSPVQQQEEGGGEPQQNQEGKSPSWAGVAWSELPAALNPLAGKVPPARAERKRVQIEALLRWAWHMLPPPPPPPAAGVEVVTAAAAAAATPGAAGGGDIVVDFCAGGGHLGLVLAALRPELLVVLLDGKQASLDEADKRAARLGLTNVRTVCGRVEDYAEPFTLGMCAAVFVLPVPYISPACDLVMW
jgi:hypothetical protein